MIEWDIKLGVMILTNYIYGAGGFAHRLRNTLIKNGFDDIILLSKSDFNQNQVIKSTDCFYLGIFNHLDDPIEILNSLRAFGVKRVISPSEAIAELADEELNTYFLTSLADYYPTENEILEVCNLLMDEESKRVLKGFYNYQVRGSLTSLVRSGGQEIQYLGTTLPNKSEWFTGNLRWIDCGAFTGDTIENIANYRKNYLDEFLCLEPEFENFERLVTKTSELGVQSVNLNVSAGMNNGFTSLSGDGISAKSNSVLDIASLEEIVPEVTLDHIALSWNPTHIKMDIEGSEMNALVGGKEVLTRCRPNLAISVYHRPRDIVEIPQYLNQILDNYSFFLRCYGAHGYDTVLYAVPSQE
jgi:FkbM family methyltransferase